MPSSELLYRALASFRVSHRHGSQRPGSQSPVKSALKWTPWPEFCEILHSDWRNRYLLDKAGLNDITGSCSARQELPFALCCCDLPRMPRICPGCPRYALDLARIRGIQGISGASGANHISNRLDKREVSSYLLFYSFVLQLSQSPVKDSKSIFCINMVRKIGRSKGVKTTHFWSLVG